MKFLHEYAIVIILIMSKKSCDYVSEYTWTQ